MGMLKNFFSKIFAETENACIFAKQNNNDMTPTTKELIFCRIEKFQSEKQSIQSCIDRIIERQDLDSMEFIEMWEIDIQMFELQIEALKKILFQS